jgi:DNA-binding response OmpR family regulator
MSLESPNVLIIDNDDDLVRGLCIRLTSLGLQCVTASSGSQGVARFANGGIDLIVSDLNMPGGDGVALAQAVRRTSDVPIIFVTGYRDDFKRRLRGIPNVTTLRKPFKAQDLVDLIAVALGTKAGAASVAGANEEAA